MKNEQIELVKKWLADRDSVSRVELVANAAYAAYAAAAAAACGDAPDASYWVERYEEITQ
tara:strand:+ start:2804 stop:2983 length:180 start_codon:yes stop_codon:yes gene_type:complete